MARRRPRNSFDIDRSDNADAPDPSLAAARRTLTSVGSVAVAEPTPSPEPEPEPVPGKAARHGSDAAPRGPARGMGGRPGRAKQPAGSITVFTVRVPVGLYESCAPLVKALNCPSWGQLVAWTCQDHGDEVAHEIAVLMPVSGRRQRRGQNRTVAPSMQISPHVDEVELEAIDRLRGQMGQAASRTAVVTAALIVARRYGDAYSG